MKAENNFLNNKLLEEETKNVKETAQLISEENEENEENDEDDEYEEKDEEKNYLIKILDKVKLQIKNKKNRNKNLGKLYNDMLSSEDDEVKNNIKSYMIVNWHKRKYKVFFYFMFLILLLFTIVNLVGIFQILSIMNILWEAVKKSIYCHYGWEDEEENYEFYNFYSYYIKESIDEGIDFDLMTTMSFLGAVLYKYSGFIWSSFVFGIINIISLFLIIIFYSGYNEYKETKETYSLWQIVYLGICWLLLFVGAGSSALFSQNILNDSYFQFRNFVLLQKKKKSEKTSNDKNKEDEEVQLKLEEKKEEEKKEEKKEEENKKEYEDILIPEKYDSKNEEDDNNDIVIPQKYMKKHEEILKKEDTKKKEEEKKEEEDIKNKNSTVYFFLICLTSVLGFFGKNLLDINVSNRKYEFDSQYNITDINTTNATDNEMKYRNDAHNEIFNHDRILFIVMAGVYFSSIILSMILYAIFNCIFESDNSIEKEDKKNIRICQIFGYTIYSNLFSNKSLNKSDKEKTKIEAEKETEKETENQQKGIKACFISIFQFICYYIIKFLECFKLFFFSIKNCCDKIICGYFCGGNAKCCCCLCCDSIDSKEYGINEHFFCYCYQGKRKSNWFKNLIENETQKKLIPIMLEFFIFQLTTIGFEKIYNKVNDDEYNNFEESKNVTIFNSFFILSLFLFFHLTISFGSLFNFLIKDEDFKNLNVEKVSNNILRGTYGVLIFNALYSFFLSLIFLTKGFNEGDNSLRNYVLIPIFMNKFYFFTFTNVSAIYTDDEDGIELVSFSTLISIYLTIWEKIIDFLTDYIPINGLFIIQIITSSLVILITILIICIFLCFINSFWLSFVYILSYIFPCGGVIFCYCFKKNFYQICNCCENHYLPCSNRDFHQNFYNCLKKRIGEQKYNELKNYLQFEDNKK